MRSNNISHYNNQATTEANKISHAKILDQDHRVARSRGIGQRIWELQKMRALAIRAALYPSGIKF